MIHPNELVSIGNGKVLHVANQDCTFTYCGKPINSNVTENYRHIDESKNKECKKCKILSPHHFNNEKLLAIYKERGEREDEERRARERVTREKSRKLDELKKLVSLEVKEAIENMGGLLLKNNKYNGAMVFEIRGVKVDVIAHS